MGRFVTHIILFFTIFSCSPRMDACQIQVDYQMKEADADVIIEGLKITNTPFFGHKTCISFAVYLRDENQHIVGGILAWMRPGIKLLCIDTIWVAEGFRNRGHGRKLMQAAENEGLKNGCTHAQLETLPFQAMEFYKKLGYVEIGRVEKLYGEHDAIYLRKNLHP